MSPADIENALGQRLALAPSLGTIVYPNDHSNPARPYLVFQHVPVSRSDNTIAGSKAIARGYAVVTIVADRGKFATPANVTAAAIMARFPKGLRLTVGTDSIVVTKPPEVSPPGGYTDGTDWRLPVRIDYATG
jgi:hypothetical protein